MLLALALIAFNYVWGLFHPRTHRALGVDVPATIYDPEHPQGVTGSARVGAISPGSGISPIGGGQTTQGVGGR